MKKATKKNVEQDVLETGQYFSTPVYYIKKEKFLNTLLPIFDEYIKAAEEFQPVNELYPSIMTGNMANDPRIREFGEYLVGTAWNILKGQGYAVDNKVAYFHSIWGQEYRKFGSMDEHVHADGAQIVGFYFLECPENCPKMILKDPRFGKNQISMSEADTTKVSDSTTSIVFGAQPGSLFFTNAWLPHSFSRNGSDKPFKFIHFNIAVKDVPVQVNTPIVV